MVETGRGGESRFWWRSSRHRGPRYRPGGRRPRWRCAGRCGRSRRSCPAWGRPSPRDGCVCGSSSRPPGRMCPTFLTSRWIIRPGKRAGIVLLTRLVCSVGSGVASSVQASSGQPMGHGTHRHHCPAYGEVVADVAGGPRVGAASVLDEVRGLHGQFLSEASNPLRGLPVVPRSVV